MSCSVMLLQSFVDTRENCVIAAGMTTRAWMGDVVLRVAWNSSNLKIVEFSEEKIFEEVHYFDEYIELRHIYVQCDPMLDNASWIWEGGTND